MAAGGAGGALLANSIQDLFHGGAGGMGGLAGGNLGIGSGHAPAMHETVVNNYCGDAAPGQDDDQVQEAAYDDDGVDNVGDSYDV